MVLDFEHFSVFSSLKAATTFAFYYYHYKFISANAVFMNQLLYSFFVALLKTIEKMINSIKITNIELFLCSYSSVDLEVLYSNVSIAYFLSLKFS